MEGGKLEGENWKEKKAKRTEGRGRVTLKPRRLLAVWLRTSERHMRRECRWKEKRREIRTRQRKVKRERPQ